MTRLTIDLPESLHKALKSISVLDGETMRKIAINAIEGYTKHRVESKIKKYNDGTPNSLDQLSQLPEDECDKLMAPYLEKLIKDLDSESSYSWEEVQEQLEAEYEV